MWPVLTLSNDRKILDISLAGLSGSETITNVKDKYGVKGDGTTDDTVKIQEALDNEKVLYFPAGTYIIDPTTGISASQDGQVIVGDGMYNTTFRVKDSINALNNIIKVESFNGVTLTDFAVDGNRNNLSGDPEVSTNYGVYISGSADSRVNRVRTFNMTGVGIHVYNSIDVIVTGCKSTANVYHGYELEQTVDCLLQGNDGSGNDRHGVFVSPGEVGGTGSIGNVISNNLFYSNQQYGVAFGIDAAGASLDLTRDNLVENNIIRQNLHYGVSLYRVDSTTLNGNLIELNGKIGIHVYKSRNNVITNNRIRANSQEGAALYDEILLEGASAAMDARGSYQNLIAHNFIETGQASGLTNSNWAIREEDAGDGNNAILDNYIPNPGDAGKVQILNIETTWSFLGDNADDEVSLRTFKEGLNISPNATLPGGMMGLDAPFGDAVLRFFSDQHSLQFVAPNGTLDMYIGGTNMFSVTGSRATAQKFRIESPTVPATAGAAGQAGDIAWDSGFIYICVATNTWKRVAIATW